MIRLWMSVAAFIMVAPLLAGCGSSAATVSGQVTYEGTPVGDGYISFIPTDGKGKDAGGPIKEGRYSGVQAPPGSKLVKVVAVRKVSFASTSEEMRRKAAEAQKGGNFDGLVEPADVIPDNAEGNNATVVLKAGPNTLDLSLKRPGKKK